MGEGIVLSTHAESRFGSAERAGQTSENLVLTDWRVPQPLTGIAALVDTSGPALDFVNDRLSQSIAMESAACAENGEAEYLARVLAHVRLGSTVQPPIALAAWKGDRLWLALANGASACLSHLGEPLRHESGLLRGTPNDVSVFELALRPDNRLLLAGKAVADTISEYEISRWVYESDSVEQAAAWIATVAGSRGEKTASTLALDFTARHVAVPVVRSATRVKRISAAVALAVTLLAGTGILVTLARATPGHRHAQAVAVTNPTPHSTPAAQPTSAPRATPLPLLPAITPIGPRGTQHMRGTTVNFCWRTLPVGQRFTLVVQGPKQIWRQSVTGAARGHVHTYCVARQVKAGRPYRWKVQASAPQHQSRSTAWQRVGFLAAASQRPAKRAVVPAQVVPAPAPAAPAPAAVPTAVPAAPPTAVPAPVRRAVVQPVAPAPRPVAPQPQAPQPVAPQPVSRPVVPVAVPTSLPPPTAEVVKCSTPPNC